MQTRATGQNGSAQNELTLIFPGLAPFYDRVRDLSWLIIRLIAGGILLEHGIVKLTGPGVAAFAAGLAHRGFEPSMLFAYVVFFNETVGAICLILGLFTRIVAPMIAIEFTVITFVAHFPNGFGFSNPKGGWEYPLMWGLLVFAISLRGGGPYSLDRPLGKEV